MRAFQTFLKKDGPNVRGLSGLHHHSIANLDRFWTDFRDFADIRAETWAIFLSAGTNARATFPTPN